MSCRFPMQRMFAWALPALVAALLSAPTHHANAQAVGDPNAGNGWSTVSAVSVFSSSGEAGSREAIYMINGSGISGQYGEFNASGTPLGNMSLFRGNTPSQAAPGTAVGSHWVQFAFDQPYSLGKTWLWNWNEGAPYTTFGWKDLTVQYSTDGVNFSTAYTGQVPLASGTGGSTPQLVFDFGGASAQYVVLTNTGFGNDENWSNGTYTNDAGLSEIRFWLNGATVPSLLLGDINNDNLVNLTDYGILKTNWAQTVTANTNGDLNGDGTVNITDFAFFKQYYNDFNSGSGLAAAVPEPASLALLAAALPALLYLRRHKGRAN